MLEEPHNDIVVCPHGLLIKKPAEGEEVYVRASCIGNISITEWPDTDHGWVAIYSREANYILPSLSVPTSCLGLVRDFMKNLLGID